MNKIEYIRSIADAVWVDLLLVALSTRYGSPEYKIAMKELDLHEARYGSILRTHERREAA